MSPSSAAAGCHLNATPGLRKHRLCLLTDSLSPLAQKQVGKFDPAVISPVIMNLFLIQTQSSLASLSISYMDERANFRSLPSE